MQHGFFSCLNPKDQGCELLHRLLLQEFHRDVKKLKQSHAGLFHYWFVSSHSITKRGLNLEQLHRELQVYPIPQQNVRVEDAQWETEKLHWATGRHDLHDNTESVLRGDNAFHPHQICDILFGQDELLDDQQDMLLDHAGKVEQSLIKQDLVEWELMQRVFKDQEQEVEVREQEQVQQQNQALALHEKLFQHCLQEVLLMQHQR